MIRAEVVDDWRALEGEWRRLADEDAAAADNVFLTWEWVGAWCEAMATPRRRPSFLVATDPGGAVAGLLPTVVEDLGPSRLGQWTLAGGGRAGGDHLGPLFAPGCEAEAAAALAARLLGGGPALARLDGLDPGSPLVPAVESAATGHPVRRLTTPCPYLPLPPSWDDLLRGWSRNRRETLRRKARLLERGHPGAVAFRRVTTAGDLGPAFDALVRLHAAGRERRGGRGAFAGARLARFHAAAAERLLARGWLRLHLLEVDGRVAAAINCSRRGGRVAFLHTGFDEALARYSPGMLVMAHAVRAAVEEGASEFDLLRGDEPYKRHWTDRSRHDVRLWVALSAPGRVYLRGHTAARVVRRRLTAAR